jgi:pre-mRNA-processing factor 19
VPNSLSFSENGTWLASSTKGQTSVTIFDLRKMQTLKVLDIGSQVESVHWDYTGQFVATAGAGCVSVQQYSKSSKSWSEPFRKAVAAKDLQWGANASSLVVLTPEGAISVLG